MQDVNLIAYGQNAHFYTPNKNINLVSGLDTISFQYHSISEYTEWNNDLPHVVYGYIFVEEDSILNINAGTKTSYQYHEQNHYHHQKIFHLLNHY